MKFNLEMKFKKGDLVEVIEQDYFRGINYPKGTCWVVDHHICEDTVRVVDESQPDGTALIMTYKLRKVEVDGEMGFKKGDIVEVINEDSWNGIDYIVGTKMVVDGDENDNTIYVFDNLGNRALLYTSKLKLVERGESVEDNELGIKIGDKVYGKNTHNEDWLAGEVLDESKPWGYLVKVLNADYQYAWMDTDTVKFLLEKDTPEPDTPIEEPTAYTQEFINQLISQAYQQFDNDSQRLAYLQGYFVK